MTNIILTAPLIDRNLTAPERDSGGVTALAIYADDTYITRGGNTYITRGGNTYVVHNNAYISAVILTAPLIDRELTAQERQ